MSHARWAAIWTCHLKRHMVCLPMILLCNRITCLWFCSKRFYNKKGCYLCWTLYIINYSHHRTKMSRIGRVYSVPGTDYSVYVISSHFSTSFRYCWLEILGNTLSYFGVSPVVSKSVRSPGVSFMFLEGEHLIRSQKGFGSFRRSLRISKVQFFTAGVSTVG